MPNLLEILATLLDSLIVVLEHLIFLSIWQFEQLMVLGVRKLLKGLLALVLGHGLLSVRSWSDVWLPGIEFDVILRAFLDSLEYLDLLRLHLVISESMNHKVLDVQSRGLLLQKGVSGWENVLTLVTLAIVRSGGRVDPNLLGPLKLDLLVLVQVICTILPEYRRQFRFLSLLSKLSRVVSKLLIRQS